MLIAVFSFHCVVGCSTFLIGGAFLPGADFVKIPGADSEVMSTEVTQLQWQSIMDYQPWGWMADSSRRFPSKNMFYEGDHYPASFISHEQAMDFCVELSRRDPVWSYRLPTAAEWVYACGDGTNSLYCYGDDERSLDEYAWYRSNSRDPQAFHEVAQKKATRWGLYDTHGNMLEWTTTTNQDGKVVCCGGSYMTKASDCALSFQRCLPPNPGYMDNGFRIFREKKRRRVFPPGNHPCVKEDNRDT